MDLKLMLDGLENTNTLPKLSFFIMNKKDFQQVLQRYNLIKKSTYREIFLDSTKYNLMEKDVWLKLIQEHRGITITNEKVSIKFSSSLDESSMNCQQEEPKLYQQVIISTTEEAKQHIPFFEDLIHNGIKYVLDVERKTYEHCQNPKDILNVDKVLFQDDSTFVVFSCNNESFELGGFEENCIRPCHCKINELLYRNNLELYNRLVKENIIHPLLSYTSMSAEEFKCGKELLEQRREKADQLKSSLIEKNRAYGREVFSSRYINLIYRNALIYGIDEEDPSEYGF